MKTIRSLIAVSLVWTIAEAVVLSDSVRRGWILAHADRDLRL